MSKVKLMSDNKFKYFTVTTTSLVKANNKADAEKIATSSNNCRSTLGNMLYKEESTERISANEAYELSLHQTYL